VNQLEAAKFIKVSSELLAGSTSFASRAGQDERGVARGAPGQHFWLAYTEWYRLASSPVQQLTK
jgi:hypothetical protein